MPARRQNAPKHSSAPEGSRFLPVAALILLLVAMGIGVFSVMNLNSRRDEIQQAAQEQPADQGSASSEKQDADTAKRSVDELMGEMTLEEKVAQMFIVPPESVIDIGVAIAAGDATKEALEKTPVGGFIYFSSNLQDPEQTREMLSNTQTYANEIFGVPMFLCVDEEGGTVAHVSSNEAFGLENPGDMRVIGDSGDTQAAEAAAEKIGNYLTDLGFNVDFAPVADIATSEDGTMFNRALGATQEAVTPMVEAQVRGFNKAGILCSAKHFPGIGGAEGDSHETTITTYRTLDEMRAFELKPFEAAIKAKVPFVMVGHVSCPEVTGTTVPASLSSEIVSGLLRSEMGYEGLIITDALNMGAATGASTPETVGVSAIQAGCDIVLMPEDFSAAYQGVLDAVASGELTEDRIDESVRRILEAKLAL